MKIKTHLFLFFLLTSFVVFSQEKNRYKKDVEFSVKVSVEAKDTRETIKDAEVFVNEKLFNYSAIKGNYTVKAQVNDQLIIRHPEFETVYYTIKSDEDIKILVEGFSRDKEQFSTLKRTSKRIDNYSKYLDSAIFYKQKDIDKSLFYVEKMLKNKSSKQQNALTYKTLADIYVHWKQYDLAESNYKLSLQIKEDVSTKIALGKIQFLLKKYEDSKNTFTQLSRYTLTNNQKITVFEFLGDIDLLSKQLKQSKAYYIAALQIAKTNNISSKITDLNSKIASVFAAQGNVAQAAKQFESSLELAEQENPIRALKEEEKVADFYNDNQLFDDEIKLRKESLKKAELNNLSKDKKAVQPDSITSQKINYKIGNAYILKEDYKGAITYLKKSKEDASKNNDIVLEKDATRKMSEVFATIGEYDKALKSYQDYVKLVDESYVQKEQEIQQVQRFSKKILENQNRISSLEKDKELADSKIQLAYIDKKLSEESNQRQRIIIYSLFGGILLMSLLAYFMFRNIKQQKLANNLLALKSMRSQMNPHFIFNALNSVNSFIAVNDERNANRYLSEFSALMRSVLENSDEDFIPLTKEIELLELYVKLEHNRFKDKFDYQINVDENILLEQFSIPPMLLQPYIENAIWHGLRYKKEKGNLDISIHKKDDETISIIITDDGIGREKSKELKTKNQLKQKSKGMSTIKARIAILNDMYKERISVNVSNGVNEKGTTVTLLLKRK